MQDRTEISVEFGNVSIGDQTARLGIKIAREHLSLTDADRIFCGRRIWGLVGLGTPDNPNQPRLPGMEDAQIVIEGAFETKQVGVRPNEYSLGLNFALKEIDVSELAKFAKRAGTVTVVSVKDLEHEDSVEDEGWEHEVDREESNESESEEDEAKRVAYKAGCDAAIDGKKRRCPYKKDDPLRAFWLRGFDATEVSGADMRQCVSCQTDYDGNEYDACPACSSEHFTRLETQEAE
jgi:ribosome modulation factor